MAANGAEPLVPVPSGAEVWLQEELADSIPGVGPVHRYRFVMPSLAALVPPWDEGEMAADLPPELLDETGPEMPLTPEEQAELDAALGELVIEIMPEDEGISIAPAMPDEDDSFHAPLPSELSPPDPALPDGAEGETGDFAPGSDDPAAGEIALPAAPDILMQDPLHRDILWLCERFVLPRLAGERPRPRQVVISMASAPSPFGSFDPEIVQLFEGFSIPNDRDACVWEPL
ncbi:DUF6497 family protein [Paracoccus sp. (in: a-proteobacteria)]|uniref:DUF6497 family protein n=1 Tax=Paracoccus sp. TaxID=267 RepID=UPI0026E0244E|nr:DUF6497 family protein [Paracoccus sp. (in: a-proteobacteria)]MDO5369749.1 DUF6497 family protein [Paracoccus sp. (in: a-proteobacteria)]